MAQVAQSVTKAIVQGRDWLTFWSSLAAPVGSVLVSAIALRFSFLQGRRTQDLTVRDQKLKEAQFRLQVFEKRYTAWQGYSSALNLFVEATEGFPKNPINAIPDAAKAMKRAITPLNHLFSPETVSAAQALFDELNRTVDILNSALRENQKNLTKMRDEALQRVHGNAVRLRKMFDKEMRLDIVG